MDQLYRTVAEMYNNESKMYVLLTVFNHMVQYLKGLFVR